MKVIRPCLIHSRSIQNPIQVHRVSRSLYQNEILQIRPLLDSDPFSLFSIIRT